MYTLWIFYCVKSEVNNTLSGKGEKTLAWIFVLYFLKCENTFKCLSTYRKDLYKKSFLKEFGAYILFMLVSDWKVNILCMCICFAVLLNLLLRYCVYTFKWNFPIFCINFWHLKVTTCLFRELLWICVSIGKLALRFSVDGIKEKRSSILWLCVLSNIVS